MNCGALSRNDWVLSWTRHSRRTAGCGSAAIFESVKPAARRRSERNPACSSLLLLKRPPNPNRSRPVRWRSRLGSVRIAWNATCTGAAGRGWRRLQRPSWWWVAGSRGGS